MTPIDKLYRDVGAALHTAQLAEYAVASTYLLLIRLTQPDKVKERLDSYWDKKSVGQLLEPAIRTGLLSPDAVRFLETFVGARNHLAHSFFMVGSHAHTLDGIGRLSKEVSEMHHVLSQALNFFDQLLSDLANTAGVNVSDVKAVALKEVRAV